jgi:hypothetical protein
MHTETASLHPSKCGISPSSSNDFSFWSILCFSNFDLSSGGCCSASGGAWSGGFVSFLSLLFSSTRLGSPFPSPSRASSFARSLPSPEAFTLDLTVSPAGPLMPSLFWPVAVVS